MKKKDTKAFVEQAEDNVTIRPIDKIMHESMLPYAEHVILDRAIPRVEDGLKPVQRRILYTMLELGILPDTPHRKSARIVGDAMGKYHPHGDSSVYDAMARMAQDFVMRGLLVDGHGNFGSMDGDPVAAMRYTEARLTNLAMELLSDIDKDTVDFQLNFDDTLKEPVILPARFPNLLVNGSSGIAVGLSTNIPPHNLGEVVEACLLRIDKPHCTVDELMEKLPAPDFPTGGILMGTDEIRKAYAEGHGKAILRARTVIEHEGGHDNIVITEIPYMVNKAAMLAKIIQQRDAKRSILSEIKDIRDESDRNGVRAVIELRKDADTEKVRSYLFKYTDLQINIPMNMVAIAEGKPRQLSLGAMLDAYIGHRRNVILRRSAYLLEKARHRQHILEGLIKAIDLIDEIIALIRSSKNPAEAKKKLVAAFDFSEEQAQAILDLKLQRLTNLEINALRKEYEQLMKQIKELEAILSSEVKLNNQLKKELNSVKERFADARRTEISNETGNVTITKDELVYVEDIAVAVSNAGDIKVMERAVYDRNAEAVLSTDYVLLTDTAHRICIFTDNFDCYGIQGSELPLSKWKDKPVPLTRYLKTMEHGVKIVGVCALKVEEVEDTFLRFVTRNGLVKLTAAAEFISRQQKIKACGSTEDDLLLCVTPTDGNGELMLITRNGMAIRFAQSEVSRMSKVGKGVKGINLTDGDSLIACEEIKGAGTDLFVAAITDNNFGKASKLSLYTLQGRGGKGFKTFTFNKNGANGSSLVYAGIHRTEDVITYSVGSEEAQLQVSDLPIQPREGRGASLLLG